MAWWKCGLFPLAVRSSLYSNVRTVSYATAGEPRTLYSRSGRGLLKGYVTMEELRPCPNCGSRDICLCFDGQLFSVWCCDCNLSTDCYIADYEAVDDWNHMKNFDE